MNYKINFSLIILSFLFLMLPIDLANGILLHNKIILPISISQAYKLILLVLFSIQLLQSPQRFILIYSLGLLLITPSIYQVIQKETLDFLFYDIVKISRYLLPLFSFFFFAKFIKNQKKENLNIAFKFIRVSYFILISSVLLKYIGLGYTMYEVGNIGSRGFFNAGNELSFLLIVLASIIAFELWRQKNTKKYILFFLLNLFVAISLSSKTAILGIFLFTFLIPINPNKLKLGINKLKYLLLFFLFLLPFSIVFSWKFIKKSALFERFSFFWDKLDVVTFIFSSRNLYAKKAWETYIEEYSLTEKIIGLGQKNFEYLNNEKIIEIDILDIFFVYGFLGIVCLVVLLFYFQYVVRLRAKSTNKYPYAKFVYLMLIIIFAISVIAGHVFNSGIAGVYLGFIFSLVYAKNN